MHEAIRQVNFSAPSLAETREVCHSLSVRVRKTTVSALAPAIGRLATIAAGALAVGLATSFASAQSVPQGPVRLDRDRCGVVNVDLQPPRTYLSVDLDRDGELEHFVATWGGVEQLRQQRGSVPPVFVHEATVFTATGANQYSCADLVAHDADHDGDLDLVYASHRELVVLENRGGRLVAGRRQPVELPFDADPRVEISGEDLRVATP
jgi:hypothetical protein